jgi:DNA-binding CsgD family transcriptional regulator
VLAAAVRWRIPQSANTVQIAAGSKKIWLEGYLTHRSSGAAGRLRASVLAWKKPIVGIECSVTGAGLYALAEEECAARDICEALDGVVGHIGQGLVHSHSVLQRSVVGAVMEAVLEGMHFPAVVVNRSGEVVFGNGVARALEGSGVGPFFESEDGRLVFGKRASDRAFTGALKAAWEDGVGEVRRIVEESVLISVRRVEAVGGSELAVVALRELGARGSHRIEQVGTLLGLTPAQTKVAVAIFEGQSVKEFAQANRTSVTTVRWHLQEVLRRVGCKSQAELVGFLWRLV